MRIRWTAEALRELEELGNYIRTFNPEAADRIVRAVFEQTDMLADFPLKGRPGRVLGTRELIVIGTNFVVPYRVVPGQVDLLAVIHTARRWPETFG